MKIIEFTAESLICFLRGISIRQKLIIVTQRHLIFFSEQSLERYLPFCIGPVARATVQLTDYRRTVSVASDRNPVR